MTAPKPSPRRLSRWFIVLAVAPAAAALAVVADGDAPAPAPPVSSLPAAAPVAFVDPRLRGDIDALQAAVHELSVRAPALAATPDGGPASAEAPLTGDEQMTRDIEVREQAMATRPRDATWSPTAEGRIRDAFATARMAGAHLDRADCGASVCRIDVRFDSIATRDDGLDAMMGLVAWDTDMVGRRDPDDPLRYTLYAARDSYTFAAVD